MSQHEGNVFNEISTSRKSSKKQSEPWLLSYSDLVTNLMAIFILLFSMSEIDVSRFDTVTHEMTRRKTDSLDIIKQRIDAVVVREGLQDSLKTDLGVSGLRVIFTGSSMFLSASAVLVSETIEKVDPVLNIFADIDQIYQISLEGHTDDVPLAQKARYADNWALSSARGVALLQVLKKKGVAINRMSVAGYADTRPVIDPSVLHGEELNSARALNRRVVIRIYQ